MLAAGAAFALQDVLLSNEYLSVALLVMLGLAILFALAASPYQFATRGWRRGLQTLLVFLLASAGLVAGFVILFTALVLNAMFGPSEDNFGKDIVIPADMVLEDPRAREYKPDIPAVDEAGRQLIAAFSGTAESSAAARINVDCKVLEHFKGPDRDLLLRHLATSAKWLVTEERGKVYAVRRCVVGGRWQSSLNGYYTAFDFREGLDHGSDGHWQERVIIDPDGPVLDRPWVAKATYARAGAGPVALKVVNDKKYGQGEESYLVVTSSGGAIEVFEQSRSRARPFTPLALKEIEDELAAVLASPTARARGFDPALMSVESVRTGPADIVLFGGGGIYNVSAYVNPAERGHVYLKVFEATRNTPLSAARLGPRSIEYTGWSGNPGETFFYDTEITVYEGDWGTYYPARFEVWFVPASGGAERKLVEKIFRIEGWER